MQRICHELDMNFGGSCGANSILQDKYREQYLVSSLMEEAISSSQMEGASTTRKVAKEMLRKKITPKDKSQQMIYNNYQTIRFIVEHKNEPLTREMLQKVHALMTEKTLERGEDAGRFRTNNEVVVEDGITHEIIHTPPSFPYSINQLPEFFHLFLAECLLLLESRNKTAYPSIIEAFQSILHLAKLKFFLPQGCADHTLFSFYQSLFLQSG